MSRLMPIAAAMCLMGLIPGSFAQNAGESFRDCAGCPEMVVVPAGSFTMGSPASELGHRNDEGPQHRVALPKALAVGKYEVTFAEWDVCLADGGCGAYRPHDEGWGRGNRPVIYVSWNDAQSYVSWLSRKTGKQYRLLSEAEWEYAARAGTTTAYYWGSEVGQKQANGLFDVQSWAHARTAPVGSFPPNGFGLYDMLGNVWEWVEDCYHYNYAGAPSGGEVWTGGGCSALGRVQRGGSWDNVPTGLRSAERVWNPADIRANYGGFRLARTF
jgi:formylglycine-generating enzyme required for sulfatase activity